MKPEQRAEVVHFYQAYAQEQQESFQSGLLRELTRYPHFVVWKTQEIDRKPHKPPYSPIYHRLADTANPASWGTLFEIDKKRFPGQNRKVGNVEFFKSNQYLTITPRLVPNTPKTIEKRHVEASYVYLTLFPTEPGQDRNTREDDAATQLWTPAVSNLIPVSEHTEHGGCGKLQAS